MIFKDDQGYLVNQTLDGMDSAFRAGIMATFNFDINNNYKIKDYVDGKGICRRHPHHFPSNNPGNFSKDQLIPLMSGLYTYKEYETNRLIFKATAKRLFFAQNFERDEPGTKKHPYPEWIRSGDPQDIGDLRLFDFADPLLFPHYLWFFARCSKLKSLELIFAPIGFLFILASIIMAILQDPKKEINQLVCMVKVLGLGKMLNLIHPDWMGSVGRYWFNRNELEYAEHMGSKL